MSELKPLPCFCCGCEPEFDRQNDDVTCVSVDQGCWIHWLSIELHVEDWNNLMLELRRREEARERAAFEAARSVFVISPGFVGDRPTKCRKDNDQFYWSHQEFDDWKASKEFDERKASKG